MKKIIYAAPKKGGKTNWIVENIIKECIAGKKCFYMGSLKTYEKICSAIEKEDVSKYLANCNSAPELTFIHIDKDNNPENDNTAVFTDDLVWEVACIYPTAVRKLFNLNINWYITLNTHEAVNIQNKE